MIRQITKTTLSLMGLFFIGPVPEAWAALCCLFLYVAIDSIGWIADQLKRESRPERVKKWPVPPKLPEPTPDGKCTLCGTESQSKVCIRCESRIAEWRRDITEPNYEDKDRIREKYLKFEA